MCYLFGLDLRSERFSSLWANGQHTDIERSGIMIISKEA
ncbi:hypothetical protein ACDA55_37345 [Rhizobium ruizarguesonis]